MWRVKEEGREGERDEWMEGELEGVLRVMEGEGESSGNTGL